ncbi:MAG: hypothetical protein NVV73_01785 [Cellvibrionaceae bacterium]|nr:hypothetical protein [Cellvibrionaceae bacterium]
MIIYISLAVSIFFTCSEGVNADFAMWFLFFVEVGAHWALGWDLRPPTLFRGETMAR